MPPYDGASSSGVGKCCLEKPAAAMALRATCSGLQTQDYKQTGTNIYAQMKRIWRRCRIVAEFGFLFSLRIQSHPAAIVVQNAGGTFSCMPDSFGWTHNCLRSAIVSSVCHLLAGAVPDTEHRKGSV